MLDAEMNPIFAPEQAFLFYPVSSTFNLYPLSFILYPLSFILYPFPHSPINKQSQNHER